MRLEYKSCVAGIVCQVEIWFECKSPEIRACVAPAGIVCQKETQDERNGPEVCVLSVIRMFVIDIFEIGDTFAMGSP